MESPPPSPLFMLALIGGFFVVFPLIWSAVCLLIAALGGWRDLAGRFRTDAEPPPNALLIGNARLGWSNYRGTMRIGRVGDALHVSVLGIFRPGHPHLQIPLEAIRVEEKSGILGRRATLHVGNFAELTLRMSDWETLNRS